MTYPYLTIDIDIESDFEIDNFIEYIKYKVDLLSYNELDNCYFATFEMKYIDIISNNPNNNINRVIELINSLPENLKNIFFDIRKKTLDIGYECNKMNYVLDSFISNESLKKASDLGFSINIRLYPDIQDKADIITI